MLKSSLKHRTLLWLVLAAACAAIGYAVGAMQTKRVAAIEQAGYAVADLWYFQEVLTSMEAGELHPAGVAIAFKADEALKRIADSDYDPLTQEHRQFRSKVLKAYKAFRDTHSDLYKFPAFLGPETKDAWVQRERALSDFLAKAVN